MTYEASPIEHNNTINSTNSTCIPYNCVLSRFQKAAQTSSSLLALTTLSLLVPAAFSATADTAEEAEIGILNLSHGTALVLLVVYGLSLLFQVRFFYIYNRKVPPLTWQKGTCIQLKKIFFFFFVMHYK